MSLHSADPRELAKNTVKTVHKFARALLGSERLRILASGVRSIPAVGAVVQDWLDEAVGVSTKPVPEVRVELPQTQAEPASAPSAPAEREARPKRRRKRGGESTSSAPKREPVEAASAAGERPLAAGVASAASGGGEATAVAASSVAAVAESALEGGDPVFEGALAEGEWDPAQHVVPKEEGKTRFADLELGTPILRAVSELGFNYCTPIQAGSLPHTLKGRDVEGKAQTGTGKTAAFLLTIYQRLLDNPSDPARKVGTPRALVLAPTRELALQIEKDARKLGKYVPHRIVTVFGGMDYGKQQKILQEKPVDILVATPGRLLDFRRKRVVFLDRVEVLVIDEADRMLDMGFIPDVTNIVASCPVKEKRQTLFFGATLTPEVNRLATRWTRDAVLVEVAPEQVASANIEQVVYLVTMRERVPLLLNLIIRQNLERVIVFTNRRDEARHLKERLEEWGLPCALLSGEVEQSRRIRALEKFRDGSVRVMVATDVAARGLHVEGISHVVNYSLPIDPEDYVHRIGRTGRAGASGISVSFATEADSFQIPSIEEFLGRPLHCQHPDDDWLVAPPKPGVAAHGNPDDVLPAQTHPGDRGSKGRPPRRSGPPRRRNP